MKKLFLAIWTIIRWCWRLLTVGITLISLVAFVVSIALIYLTFSRSPTFSIPDNSVLVFAPKGNVVEKRSAMNPIIETVNEMAGIPLHNEVFLQDAVDAIGSAAKDKRIQILFIRPDQMANAGLDQIEYIGKAINGFKAAGKKVIAAGDSFNQMQYLLASYADEIYLQPMGSVRLHGFGIYSLYFKDFLEKLAIDFHIFRVGTFKSAVEPLERNDMSPAAREANSLWLNALWEEYCTNVASHRAMTVAAFKDMVNHYPTLLDKAQGDYSQLALDCHLVDGIKNRQEIQNYLIECIGQNQNKEDLSKISYSKYMQTLSPSYSSRPDSGKLIGIINASGTIVYRERSSDQIASEALIRSIERAKKDDRIEALVLRISTGGGSAFASELIRQELIDFQKTGKKLVISMGSIAASGGYWLSANADKIVASPMTLTGSIGIFGAVPTLENALEKIGIHGDGVGTGRTALYGNITSDMSSEEAASYQLSVEHGYQQFISIVSEGRKMASAKVKMIAEGRVWDGKTARQIGLVDTLGDLDDAIATAADISGIPPENTVYINQGVENIQEFLEQLGDKIKVQLNHSFFTGIPDSLTRHAIKRQSELESLSTDPGGLYAKDLLLNQLTIH